MADQAAAVKSAETGTALHNDGKFNEARIHFWNAYVQSGGSWDGGGGAYDALWAYATATEAYAKLLVADGNDVAAKAILTGSDGGYGAIDAYAKVAKFAPEQSADAQAKVTELQAYVQTLGDKTTTSSVLIKQPGGGYKRLESTPGGGGGAQSSSTPWLLIAGVGVGLYLLGRKTS